MYIIFITSSVVFIIPLYRLVEGEFAVIHMQSAITRAVIMVVQHIGPSGLSEIVINGMRSISTIKVSRWPLYSEYDQMHYTLNIPECSFDLYRLFLLSIIFIWPYSYTSHTVCNAINAKFNYVSIFS